METLSHYLDHRLRDDSLTCSSTCSLNAFIFCSIFACSDASCSTVLNSLSFDIINSTSCWCSALEIFCGFGAIEFSISSLKNGKRLANVLCCYDLLALLLTLKWFQYHQSTPKAALLCSYAATCFYFSVGWCLFVYYLKCCKMLQMVGE